MEALTHFTEDLDSCQMVESINVHITMKLDQGGAFPWCGLRLEHAPCPLEAVPGIWAHMPLAGTIKTIQSM